MQLGAFFLFVVRSIVVTDVSDLCGVVTKLDDGVGSIHSPTVMGIKGVEKQV